MSKSIKSFGYLDLFHTFVVDKLIFCMKIIENTTAYKCEFCGKTSLRRHNMVSHENACSKNPKNWAMCHDCANFDANYDEAEMVEVSRWYSTWIGDKEETKCMYPHKCKCDGMMLFNRFHMNKNWVETLEEEDGWRVMPNKLDGCPNFKPFNYDDVLDAIF